MRKVSLVLMATALVASLVAALVVYSPAQAADATWTATYWNNVKLGGKSVITRQESTLVHDWGTNSPIPGTVKADQFSARWTRTVSFAAGTYLFRTISDDGIRVWVDDVKVIDQWDEHGMQTYVIPVALAAGDHAIKVEYYEGRGAAIASLTYGPVAANAWTVQYYNNPNLSGKPVLTRSENLLKNYWNAASPAPGVKPGSFSTRWARTETLATGKYQFKVTASGGFRLYVDNKLVLDEWYNHTTQAVATLKLNEGDHKVRLEYYNQAAPATLILAISAK